MMSPLLCKPYSPYAAMKAMVRIQCTQYSRLLPPLVDLVLTKKPTPTLTEPLAPSSA
jgi:hypothetical protein